MILTGGDILARSKSEMLQDLMNMGFTLPDSLKIDLNDRHVIGIKGKDKYFIPFCLWSDHSYQVIAEDIVLVSDLQKVV